MKQRKIRWRGIALAALTAVLIGSMANPQALEASGVRDRLRVYGTEPSVIENETQNTETVVPEAPAVSTEPVVKTVARVNADGADTDYTDIKEAWAAVNGRTAKITLLDSVTTEAAMNTAFELTGGNVTLDLNGFKWTYQYTADQENGPATVDLIELRGDASLTVQGGTGSAMVYAGSSNYKGACLYATGSSTLTIEGGTFSSNVSAPVYVDGATLQVKGGIFKAAGAKESAITMNNGTFSMTGGEVQVGTLTLNNTNGSQNVAIGGDSQLSGIETKGKDALSIKDTLADGYGYRDPENTKETLDEDVLTGNSVGSVVSDEEWIKGLTIEAAPADTEFTYNNGETITLTAKPVMADAHKDAVLKYEWSCNNGNLTLSGATDKEASFTNTGLDAGIYEFSLKVSVETEPDQVKTAEQTIEIKPVSGTIIDNGYKTNYVYGEKLVEPENGGGYFDLPSDFPAPETLNWSYTWYEGDSISDSSIPAVQPLEAGTYTVRVTAEGKNYHASRDFTITVNRRKVLPRIAPSADLTKVYDGSEILKDVKIELVRENSGPDEAPIDSFLMDAVFENEIAGTNKTVKVLGVTLPENMEKKYELTQTACTATGTIQKAHFTLDIEVQPLTQSINKPVTVTVTISGDENQFVKPADIQLTARGNNTTTSIPLTQTSGGSGKYTGTFTSAAEGDFSFSAKVDTTNYDSNEDSESRVTFSKEIIESAITLQADKTDITFGEEVTYTAAVTKKGGQSGDSLNGWVQFYLNGEGSANKVGNPYPITASGGTASITLNSSVLTEGNHTVLAMFTSDTAEDSKSAPVNTKVAPKPVEKTKTAVSIKASDSEITYGDDVTYTATVTIENGKAGETLSGGVQFYMDEVKSSNRVGSARTIKVSGDKAKVELGKSDLTAGDHTIIAVFTPASADTVEGAQAETSTKVEKKKLTWNTSGLRASKTAGTSGEVKVYGTLEVEGILDGEIKFEQPESMMTSGFKSADAGSYKVSVVLEDKEEWKFDPKEPKNYELPDGDPEIKATVNALKELSDPPEAKDGNSYKLVMEEGLSKVPDGLKSTGYNTPVKIEQELKRILTSSGVYSEENTKVYDVTLQVSTDEGKTWVEANAGNFPSGGIMVTLPYPGGTGRYTHNFAVAHMFGESLFGHTSGTVEVPSVTKTDNGIRFRVTGLSPIAVSWTNGAGGRVNGTSSSSGNAVQRLLGAQTGDDSPILLYVGLAAGCTLLLLILGIVFFKRRRKKTR
ncbi:MAG: LPXTG cell wall anchor domain-containing protein [Lachnospiraceae bacterium]|nr:LPXTG cell wall anchor domain-containing protein [Lachnospiraceae bacterium]